MEKQTHREPTLYIVGNIEKKDEIRHILECEWGGKHREYSYGNSNAAYFVGIFGYVSSSSLDNDYFKEAVANGLMKEYKLPEKENSKCEFKPFDKVVVRNPNREWCADLFSHVEEDDYGKYFAVIGGCYVKECLPYNEDTARLIGTKDDFDYDKLK